MKNIGLILSALVMMTGYTFAGAANTLCPISGKAIGDATSEVKAEFCCGKCKAKFDKAPTKFAKKLAKAEAGKCIVSGKAADADEASALVVGFCCDKCKAKFDADPAKYVGKLGPAKKKKKDS